MDSGHDLWHSSDYNIYVFMQEKIENNNTTRYLRCPVLNLTQKYENLVISIGILHLESG